MATNQSTKNKLKDTFPYDLIVRGSVYTTFQTFGSNLILNREGDCYKKNNSKKGLLEQ